MRREIVRDDVNRSALRLTGDDLGEEIDKRGTRVARYGLAEHFTGLGIESGEQGEGAVPVVLEPMALSASGRQRQHGIEAIERLNGGFLVDGEHRSVVRRIDVQANHVGGLRLEV